MSSTYSFFLGGESRIVKLLLVGIGSIIWHGWIIWELPIRIWAFMANCSHLEQEGEPATPQVRGA
jgi:hypothetical protein